MATENISVPKFAFFPLRIGDGMISASVKLVMPEILSCAFLRLAAEVESFDEVLVRTLVGSVLMTSVREADAYI